MLVDISRNEDEVLDSIRKSDWYADGNFMKEFFRLQGNISSLITSSKIYVLDNYQKIEDWSELSLRLYHNKSQGQPNRFGLKEEERKRRYPPMKSKGNIKSVRSPILEGFMKKIDDETTQIETLCDCVYDWTDGDFSLKINGVDYLWIDGESVKIGRAHV